MPQLTIVIISLISETVINSYEKSFGTLYAKDRILSSMEIKTAYILDLT
jgi:hypothetical protein